ncbi:60Kd inner membrane protein-domain-containing protein [Phakopsora pachyrhizi]|uniref:60Kd inner membrane protein-domain-containing protein n=1 Tax=Phakopsora pachyrhizi TaxID=170000 RepID=A0AAV0B0R6_PHAPC|nr:60Kd inner membrane protein-domain-containing protein [Phakopsora pachyrhizi]
MNSIYHQPLSALLRFRQTQQLRSKFGILVGSCHPTTSSIRWNRSGVHPHSLNQLSSSNRSYSLTSGCVDLFLSSTPLGFPGVSLTGHPFTASIVILTLSIRTIFTLPISIWSRNRINRLQHSVLPLFKSFESKILKTLKLSSPSNKSDLGLDQRKAIKRLLKTEFRRLIAKYNCNPILTSIIPLAIHLPILFVSTSTLHQIPSHISESHQLYQEVLLYSSLVEPNLGLSLITWLTFLINLEINFAFRHLKQSQPQSNQGWIQVLKDPNSLRTVSFLGGVMMMGLSSTQPSLVLVYWLTSNMFSIAQSLVFNLLDKKSTLNSSSTDQIGFNVGDSSLTTSKENPSLSTTSAGSRRRRILPPPKID